MSGGGITYPALSRRVAATSIDVAVVVGAIYFAVNGPLLGQPLSMQVSAAVAIFALYEPLLTAYACTAGQALMRTRVRDHPTLERIALRQSYLRFLVKYTVSIMAAAPNLPRDDLRANHDRLAGTVVIGV